MMGLYSSLIRPASTGRMATGYVESRQPFAKANENMLMSCSVLRLGFGRPARSFDAVTNSSDTLGSTTSNDSAQCDFFYTIKHQPAHQVVIGSLDACIARVIGSVYCIACFYQWVPFHYTHCKA